jgi:PadR family transcriptional regulator PadR
VNNQYKKGVLELCVLSVLSRRDCYGYDAAELLSSRMELSDGAVYPILRKLKADGLVTTYLSEESGGPPRKYYSMTERGRREYQSAVQEWISFVEIVGDLLGINFSSNWNGGGV